MVDASGLSARFTGSDPDFHAVMQMAQMMPEVTARVVPAGSFSRASALRSGVGSVVSGASSQWGGQVAAR
jgi:hypothetical protein